MLTENVISVKDALKFCNLSVKNENVSPNQLIIVKKSRIDRLNQKYLFKNFSYISVYNKTSTENILDTLNLFG